MRPKKTSTIRNCIGRSVVPASLLVGLKRRADCHFSKKEISVPSIHERAATRDGAANAVAQMISRIPPVGMDAPLTNQSFGELAM